jgi:diaminopimelate decarboxylase/aspartate kinase
MTEKWLVLKFGGTSVTGRYQWETIESLARQRLDQGYRVVLVCSALAGITNALQELSEKTESHNGSEVNNILFRHRQLGAELGIEIEDLLREADKHIAAALRKVSDATCKADYYAGIASLLPVGEWLSTRIGERYLARKLVIDWVDACDALQAIEEDHSHVRRTWLSARCTSSPDPKIQARWLKKAPLLITQGFVAAHPQGGKVLLGRGGSDTSAVLLASRLEASHLEIWTDVPGLFSADPRVIPDARLLQILDYNEALEMAASGAKVVHSRCIRAAADAGIRVRIGDLSHISLTGTVIQSHDANSSHGNEGIRGVCCQGQMAVLLLQNLDTREQVGFLAWVFDQISRAGISIDLVATSETTTTVAINMVSNHLDNDILSDLASTLRQRCAVTVFPHCSAINLVGRGIRVALARMANVSGFFADHPLLMLSQSANDLCLSMMVHTSHANELLDTLHGALIGIGLDEKSRDEVFGPTWRELMDDDLPNSPAKE